MRPPGISSPNTLEYCGPWAWSIACSRDQRDPGIINITQRGKQREPNQAKRENSRAKTRLPQRQSNILAPPVLFLSFHPIPPLHCQLPPHASFSSHITILLDLEV